VIWIARRAAGQPEGTPLLGLVLFAALAGASAISLHGIDRLGNVTVQAVPLMQWLKLSAASLSFLALSWNCVQYHWLRPGPKPSA
jgi:hypothetical protein